MTGSGSFLHAPNPASTAITVLGDIRFDRIQVMDLAGRTMLDQPGTASIDIRAFSSGACLVEPMIGDQRSGKPQRLVKPP